MISSPVPRISRAKIPLAAPKNNANKCTNMPLTAAKCRKVELSPSFFSCAFCAFSRPKTPSSFPSFHSVKNNLNQPLLSDVKPLPNCTKLELTTPNGSQQELIPAFFLPPLCCIAKSAFGAETLINTGALARCLSDRMNFKRFNGFPDRPKLLKQFFRTSITGHRAKAPVLIRAVKKLICALHPALNLEPSALNLKLLPLWI